MPSQLFFEDVQAGMELPPLTREITRRRMVQFSGATEDWSEIHYDDEAARRAGFPRGAVTQGTLVWSILGQLMTDWIGEQGALRRLEAQYRGMVWPGDVLTCKGVVTEKYVKNGERYVECEVWAENQNGEKVTPGRAVAVLPTRG